MIATTPPKSTKATILLVDDDQMVLKMLQSFLESQNYHVICASSGREALALIEQQQNPIDLLITDIRMPEMDGVQLLEAVRQLLPTLPMLLMTGYSDFDLVVLGLKQHAFDLLFKPIDFDQMNWCITKALAFKMVQRLEQQYTTRLEEQVAQQTSLLCKQLEELHEAQRKASEADHLKHEFLCLISHELRTPLNGITGAVQLIEDGETPGLNKEHLEILKTSTQRMSNLVNNLLTLVGARAYNQTGHAIMSTACGVLESLEQRYSKKAASSGMTFRTDCASPADLQLTGPWDALHIVANCLLDNAFKFTERGGEITYRLWSEAITSEHARVNIQVTDNGCGIPLSCQELLFQPFTQVDNYLTRRNDGIGIGLAIVRSLCDKLHGSLTLESSPEKGSSFTCSLPFHSAGKD
jgi:signal transduction histidine kinase